MKLSDVRRFFLYCTIINYVILLAWYFMLYLPHGWLYNTVSVNIKVSQSEFDQINLLVMIIYKIGIVLFNLVPWLVLYLIRERKAVAELSS